MEANQFLFWKIQQTHACQTMSILSYIVRFLKGTIELYITYKMNLYFYM